MECFLPHTEKEDIYETPSKIVGAKQAEPDQDRIDMAKSLFGIIPADLTLEEARVERLNQV